MERAREPFVDAARKRDVDDGIALRVFEDLAQFAEYAFNKSHSAAHAVLRRQRRLRRIVEHADSPITPTSPYRYHAVGEGNDASGLPKSAALFAAFGYAHECGQSGSSASV